MSLSEPYGAHFCYIKCMELEPNTENVVYIDEYPELAKKVWLRRLNAQRQLGKAATGNHLCEILVLPEPPDGAA